MGRSGSRASRTTWFSIWIRAYLHPRVPGWFYRWPELLIGIITWALKVRTQSPEIPVLVVVSPSPTSPSQSHYKWVSSIDFPAIPTVWGQSRGSHKMTHNAGGVGCPSWVLFSHWRSLRLRGDLACMVMRWPGGGAMWSLGSCFSYPTDAVCPGVPGAKGCPLSPPNPRWIPGLLQWCLLEWLLVLLLAGSEVRNNVCYHLNHVTLSSKFRSDCSSFLLRF